VEWIKVVSVIFIFAAFLFLQDIALARSIGIGITPVVLKYNFPGVYSKEFCFFNQGDTDAVYVIQSGDIKVLNEINFTVPANTDFNTCIKKTLQLVVDKTGYFYVLAYPNVTQISTVSIVRRVGVKVELSGYSTQTLTTGNVSSSGGSVGVVQQVSNTTNATSILLNNQTSQPLTATGGLVVNVTRNETNFELKNETLNISESFSGGEANFNWVRFFILFLVITIFVAVSYFLFKSLGFI
jgi:hypothetical protein